MAQKSQRNAVDRLKDRIAARIDEDRDRPKGFRRTQTELAKKIGISKPTLNELLNGPSSTRGLLAHLDKIADYFGVPPSILIHRNDTALIELQQGEYRLITHWRNLPADVQETIMAMFDYFAGLLPEEREARRIWRMWRVLGRQDQARLDEMLREAYRLRRTGAAKTTLDSGAHASAPATETPPRAKQK